MELESITGPRTGGRDITIRRFAVRRRLMDIAKQRFVHYGYEHVSLQDVAAAAGMDWGDFLMYFRDKSNLLTAILDDGWRGLLPHLHDMAASSTTAHGALVNMFTFMTSALHKDEDLVRLLLYEGRRANPETHEIRLSDGYRRFMQMCQEVIVRGQRDGSFRSSCHPQVAASMLIGALEGMLRDRLIAEQDRTVTSYSTTYLISTFDALVSSLQH